MQVFLNAAEAASIQSQLPELRTRFGSAQASPDERVSACTEAARLYGRLGLTDRAADWLRAAANVSEDSLSSHVFYRYHAVASWLWLDRGDGQAAARSLDCLKRGTVSSLEDERLVLAGAVRLALLQSPFDAFAPLERAFRHLRSHPSPLWLCRLLLWRARWLSLQGRTDEILPTVKKALAEALKAGDLEAELQCLLALAQVPGLSKSKALRATRTALEKALAAEVPAAAAQAHWVLSRLTAGQKESESSLAFQAFFDEDQGLKDRAGLWDRLARDEDARVFEESGRGQRRREAELLAAIAGKLSAEPDLSRSLEGVYQPVRSLMAADVFGIALWAPDQAALDYALFIEDGRRTRVGLIPVDSTRSLGAWCFRARKAVRINDIDREYGNYLKELSRLSEHRPKSMLFQPLLSDGDILGIVTVQSFLRDAYGPEAEAHLAVVAACVALRLQGRSRSV